MVNESKVESGIREKFSWPIFILMAATTFVAMVGQNIPSGILPQMSQGLNVDSTKIGDLLGVYALASALSAIPLATLTVTMNRKRILLLILGGFLISNLGIALTSSYGVALAFRLVGGMAAGLIWSMISPYGMKLAPKSQQGLAIAVIIGGSTLGISIGNPIFTAIGANIGWRIEFISLSVLIVIIMLLVLFFLPSVAGEERTRSNSPFELIKNRGIQKVILLTMLAVIANYGLFTYMALLVEDINFTGGIELATLLFGGGSFISVIIAGKYLDDYLKGTVTFMMGIGAVSALLFIIFGGVAGISHLNFILWGIGFGALVTIFQNAVTRQVKSGQSVATSIQSSAFNFAIMIGSSVSGILFRRGSLQVVVIMAFVILTLATILSATDNHTLVQEKL